MPNRAEVARIEWAERERRRELAREAMVAKLRLDRGLQDRFVALSNEMTDPANKHA
jgi:hypothetical protein